MPNDPLSIAFSLSLSKPPHVPTYIPTNNKTLILLDVLSQAIVANNTVYCSGAIGVDPTTGKLVEGTVADRTVSSNNHHHKPKPTPNQPRKENNLELMITTIKAPHNPKPLRNPARRKQQPRRRRQSQRLPIRHVALRRDERSLQAVLGRHEA